MDIVLSVCGLVTFGNYISNKKKNETDKKKITNNDIDITKSGGNNIFDNNYYHKVKQMESEAVINNVEKSFDPQNTNIIPLYYGNISETNANRSLNPYFKKELVQREISKFIKSPIINKKIQSMESETNSLSPLNRDNSYMTNGWYSEPTSREPSGIHADTILNSTEKSLIYKDDVKTDVPMTHNNMVPFFGSTSKQTTDINDVNTANRLEKFTGNFKLDKQHKTEVGSIFAPVQQNLEQLEQPRDLDRYVTNLQRRNNETPFEKISVGPGLNDGYTATPSGGFHNPVRILPKNIDQLCVNPRTVNEGRIIRGKHSVDKRTAQAEMYKYRPELLVTNFDGERNMTCVGAVTRPTTQSKQVFKPTNRQQSTQVLGTANTQYGSKNIPRKLQGKIKASTKKSVKSTPYRNVVQAEGKKHHSDDQLKTYIIKSDDRENINKKYYNEGHSTVNLKSSKGENKAPMLDIAKDTKKQLYINSKNPTGNVQTSTIKGVVYDPANLTKTTIRETTENNTYAGNVQSATIKGIVYDPANLTKTTIRETTENNNYSGNVQASTIKGLVYDPANLTKTTIRETTENNNYSGNVQASSIKGLVYDPANLTKTTIRETTENNTHSGNVQTSSIKGKVYDENDKAKKTIRETTEYTNNVGIVSNSEKKGQIVYDPFDIAKTTIRETTENNKNIGNVSISNMKNGGYETFDDNIKSTQREGYSDTYYVKPGGQADAPQNPMSQESTYNMRQNVIKEEISRGRYPTLSGLKNSIGKDGININIKKIESDEINKYSATRNPIISAGHILTNGGNITSNKNSLPPYNIRIDDDILTAFNNCPLTKSLSSYA